VRTAKGEEKMNKEMMKKIETAVNNTLMSVVNGVTGTPSGFADYEWSPMQHQFQGTAYFATDGFVEVMWDLNGVEFTEFTFYYQDMPSEAIIQRIEEDIRREGRIRLGLG
jgi:hypothetical protein